MGVLLKIGLLSDFAAILFDPISYLIPNAWASLGVPIQPDSAL